MNFKFIICIVLVQKINPSGVELEPYNDPTLSLASWHRFTHDTSLRAEVHDDGGQGPDLRYGETH